jgi:hypothetical protein
METDTYYSYLPNKADFCILTDTTGYGLNHQAFTPNKFVWELFSSFTSGLANLMHFEGEV